MASTSENERARERMWRERASTREHEKTNVAARGVAARLFIAVRVPTALESISKHQSGRFFLLCHISSQAQRSDFAQMMNAVSYKPGQFVWKLGDNAFFSFLVATGQVHVQGPRFKQVATTTVGEEAKGDEAKGTAPSSSGLRRGKRGHKWSTKTLYIHVCLFVCL